jgi:hypothetical protein
MIINSKFGVNQPWRARAAWTRLFQRALGAFGLAEGERLLGGRGEGEIGVPGGQRGHPGRNIADRLLELNTRRGSTIAGETVAEAAKVRAGIGPRLQAPDGSWPERHPP